MPLVYILARPGTQLDMDQAVQAGWRNAVEVMKSNYSLTNDAVGVFCNQLAFQP